MGGVITSAGKRLYMRRLIGTSRTVPSVFQVGTGTNEPVVGDTALQNPVVISGGSNTKVLASGYPIINEADISLTFRGVLSSTDANGNTLTEFGIFNTDGTPILYSRDTYDGIVKNSLIQIIYESIDVFV